MRQPLPNHRAARCRLIASLDHAGRQPEHLFDPFHGDDERGSRLGLSIAEQHGGYIEATNEGLGGVFTVVLPTR
ncbi:MAG: hypothetical protein MUF54_21180 [Polyangiaceae bacterium]|nr:hypothetical protein [Polyangiaceae bacterium]